MQAPFYHVGLIVPDLGQARRDLTGSLGLTWASEQHADMPVLIDGEPTTRELCFVYSVEGPPYVELIAAAEPPWDMREGMHHMGIWSEDLLEDLETLESQGYRKAVTGITRGGASGGFAYLNSPAGLLVELVDTRSKAAFDRWLAGGEYF
ncbi:MAG: VOC family protein [Nostocoides sp.]